MLDGKDDPLSCIQSINRKPAEQRSSEISNAKFEVPDKTNSVHEASSEQPGQTTNLDNLAEVVAAQSPALVSDAETKSGLESLKILGSIR